MRPVYQERGGDGKRGEKRGEEKRGGEGRLGEGRGGEGRGGKMRGEGRREDESAIVAQRFITDSGPLPQTTLPVNFSSEIKTIKERE